MTCVVTGAGRGIGLEFVRQLSTAGRRVHAVVRDPSGAAELQSLAAASPRFVVVHRGEVTRDDDMRALAQSVGDEPVALLINNAGVLPGEKPLESLSLDELTSAFEVNAVAPVRVTRALLPALRRAAPAKVVQLSTKMASMADDAARGYYAYRMSKGALNMAVRLLAHDLRADGVSTYAMHPGYVKTDMGGPGARLEVADAVRAMLDTIEKLEPSASGGFIDYRGRGIAW